MHGFRRCFYIAYDPVNTITLAVKFIVAQLKLNVDKNQETGG
jgi:hypothetical protein